MPCDQNAEKTMLVHKEVSDPIFENRENGTLRNISSTSATSVRINGISHEPQGVDINSNDILVNRPSHNAPLRLTGGGDTSFECQDDENVNFTSTSSPFFECREITSSMEGQGIGSFDNVAK